MDFRLDDLHLRMEFSDPFVAKAFAGGGIFSSIPFSPVLASVPPGWTGLGSVEFGRRSMGFHRRDAVCRTQLGAGFPLRWWWGQAHDFGGADVSVAFSGGLLELGPLRRDVAGVVVRLGRKVIRLTRRCRCVPVIGDDHWSIRADRRGTRSSWRATAPRCRRMFCRYRYRPTGGTWTPTSSTGRGAALHRQSRGG